MSSSISSSDRSGLRYSLGLDACLVDERRLLQKGPYRCGMGNYLTQSGLPARLGKVRLRLPFARKPHSEDRLAIVGSRFRGAAMTLSDLADDIQPKSERSRIPFLGGETLQRLKELIHSLPIDSGTAIAYPNPNVALLAHHRNAHWRIGGSVVDCICD
mgnify:CR=1 FL=1